MYKRQISDREFQLTPSWQLINIRSFERELSFITGRIYKDQLNQTIVDFYVRPNSIFIIFFYLFPTIATFILFSDFKNDNLILILIFGIVVPVSYTHLDVYKRQHITSFTSHRNT